MGNSGCFGSWLGKVDRLEQLSEGEIRILGSVYTVFVCVTFNRFLESNWFVWVTQMNHIPMHIDHDRNMDWVSTQVRDSHSEDWSIT